MFGMDATCNGTSFFWFEKQRYNHNAVEQICTVTMQTFGHVSCKLTHAVAAAPSL
jgi:hypothetical protein